MKDRWSFGLLPTNQDVGMLLLAPSANVDYWALESEVQLDRWTFAQSEQAPTGLKSAHSKKA